MCWCTISLVDAFNEVDHLMAIDIFSARAFETEAESLEPSLVETVVTIGLTIIQMLIVGFIWVAMAIA